MKRIFKIAIAVGILGTAAYSQAAVIMLDFGPTTVTNSPNPNFTNSPLHSVNSGFTDTSWNQIQNVDVGSGLLFSNGAAATGVAINLGRESTGTSNIIDLATNPAGSLAGTAFTTGIYVTGSVARDAVFQSVNDTATGFQVTGLSAGSYQVYVVSRNTAQAGAYGTNSYAAAGVAASNFNYSAVTPSLLTNLATTTTWISGNTYSVISITLTAGQALNVAVQGTGTAANGRGFLSAAQIVLIPEPTSVAALAIFGLGAIIRRPMRSASRSRLKNIAR